MPDKSGRPTPGPTAVLAADDAHDEAYQEHGEPADGSDPTTAIPVFDQRRDATDDAASGSARPADGHGPSNGPSNGPGPTNGHAPTNGSPTNGSPTNGSPTNGSPTPRIPTMRTSLTNGSHNGRSATTAADAAPEPAHAPRSGAPASGMFDEASVFEPPHDPPYPRSNDVIGIRPPSPRGRALRGLVAALMAGVILGGVAGGVVGVLTAGGATASALVEIAAPADPGLVAATGDGGSQSADSLANFAANEFASLSSDAFRDQVSEKAGEPDGPSITVTRVGQSTVADFSAKGATDEAGLKVVRAGVDLYIARRTDDYRAYVKDSIASIDKTLRDIQVPGPSRTPDPSLAARVDRLLSARSDLQLLANRDAAPIRVIDPPATAETGGSSPWLLGAVLGALAGGLLAVGLMMLVRSRSTAVLDAAAAESVVGRVLHPVVALPRDWTTSSLQVLRTRDRYAAKVLAGQVAGPMPLVGRTIGVVAASKESASRAVATFLAVGAADLAPTVLAEFGTDGHPLVPEELGNDPVGVRFKQTEVDGLTFTRIEDPAGPGRAGDATWHQLVGTVRSGRRCVIVDVGVRPELLRMLPTEVESVVVVGLGLDDARHVSALAAGLPGPRSATVGVVTQLPWLRQLTLKLGRRKNA